MRIYTSCPLVLFSARDDLSSGLLAILESSYGSYFPNIPFFAQVYHAVVMRGRT